MAKSNPANGTFLKAMRPLAETYAAFLRKSDRRIRSLGLTSPQFEVIATLGDSNNMTCKSLSERSLVTRGTLTGVLDRLEAKGLVERVPSRQDRRSIIIRLTVKGQKLYRKVFPAQMSYMKPYFDRVLTTKEMNGLSEMLLRLKGSLEQQ